MEGGGVTTKIGTGCVVITTKIGTGSVVITTKIGTGCVVITTKMRGEERRGKEERKTPIKGLCGAYNSIPVFLKQGLSPHPRPTHPPTHPPAAERGI